MSQPPTLPVCVALRSGRKVSLKLDTVKEEERVEAGWVERVEVFLVFFSVCIDEGTVSGAFFEELVVRRDEGEVLRRGRTKELSRKG